MGSEMCIRDSHKLVRYPNFFLLHVDLHEPDFHKFDFLKIEQYVGKCLSYLLSEIFKRFASVNIVRNKYDSREKDCRPAKYIFRAILWKHYFVGAIINLFSTNGFIPNHFGNCTNDETISSGTDNMNNILTDHSDNNQ